jgi:hypothetical protein
MEPRDIQASQQLPQRAVCLRQAGAEGESCLRSALIAGAALPANLPSAENIQHLATGRFAVKTL